MNQNFQDKNNINFSANHVPKRNIYENYTNKVPNQQGSKNTSRKNSMYNDSSNNINNIAQKGFDNNAINQNNGKSLIRNVKYLEEDNNKLRELLSDLNNELKEKEDALNESQKIIFKLNKIFSYLKNNYYILILKLKTKFKKKK